MRGAAFLLLLLLGLPAAAQELPAITYHDIVPKRNGDPYAITVADFEQQMAYLKRRGYQPVSLALLEEVRSGRARLPEKPVLLTFDDGLKSYYTHAFPILERYRYPSVVAVVTAWVDGRSVPEGYRTQFMSWDEIRHVARSPRVEIASHSDDLHQALLGNPWGNRMPAGVVRIYDSETGRYENEDAHRERVRRDLERTVARLKAELGAIPRAIVWPYGRYDAILVQEAAALGMGYHLTLSEEPARTEALPRIDRSTFKHYRALSDFGDLLSFRDYRRRQVRFVQIDLAPLTGRSDAEREALLSGMLARLQLLRPNAVIVVPFTADGRRAFFPNPLLPLEADYLSRVTVQIQARSEVLQVYVRLPAGTERLGAEFYAELARLNPVHGLIFDARPEAVDLQTIRSTVEEYVPGVRLWVAGERPMPGADGALVELDAGGDTRDWVRKASLAEGRGYFLIRQGTETAVTTLRSAMAALRRLGVAHYGYGPDDVVGGRPDPLAIAGPLREYTIREEP